MNTIRRATKDDAVRIAEILVFNNRINFYPIFQDEGFSFKTVNVRSVMEEYLADDGTLLKGTYLYDDGVVRGLIRICGDEVEKLFVEPAFQSMGVGAKLLEYAVKEHGVTYMWALEKNLRGIQFYARHGFHPNGERKFEEDTPEYLVKLVRQK